MKTIDSRSSTTRALINLSDTGNDRAARKGVLARKHSNWKLNRERLGRRVRRAFCGKENGGEKRSSYVSTVPESGPAE